MEDTRSKLATGEEREGITLDRFKEILLKEMSPDMPWTCLSIPPSTEPGSPAS